MPARLLNRADYGRMSTDELQRRLRDVRDRIERADTFDTALADCFCEQELCAVLTERGETV